MQRLAVPRYFFSTNVSTFLKIVVFGTVSTFFSLLWSVLGTCFVICLEWSFNLFKLRTNEVEK